MRGHFLKSLARNTIQSWENELDHVNAAIRQGKALDQLEQRLSGVPGYAGMIIDATATSSATGERDECRVIITTNGVVPREIQSSIALIVAEVNKRSNMRIIPQVVPSSEKLN
jgi:hypothetical protein